MKKIFQALSAIVLLSSFQVPQSDEITMLTGNWTKSSKDEICAYSFNQNTGVAVPVNSVKLRNPSFFTLSADSKHIYSVSEYSDNKASVSTISFDKDTRAMSVVNTVPAMGESPCNITTDGTSVYVANYTGGSVVVFPLTSDGIIEKASLVLQYHAKGADTERQEKSHLHCVKISPDGNYLFADDLGGDCIYKYQIKDRAGKPIFEKGNPDMFNVAAGSGPRHLTFSPNGKQAYLMNEISGTVIVFDYMDGNLKEKQTVKADTVHAQGSADIHLSPDGKFLYASNRLKADGIAIFQVDANGFLVKVGYQLTGIHPRNFGITPNGKFVLVACRDSDVIQVFKRDFQTGLLTNTHQDIKIEKPVCIQFVK